MSDPVLHLLAGPNGAGKSTFYEQLLAPTTGLRFINADQIAAIRWPGAELQHAYEASDLAAAERDRAIDRRESFITETVFSHPSKSELVRHAKSAGYRVTLHVIVIPEELAVTRVQIRVELGGHDVPEDKIRGRYARLWQHIADGIESCDESFVYDNSRARRPFRLIARYHRGRLIGNPDWPTWTPHDIRAAGLDP